MRWGIGKVMWCGLFRLMLVLRILYMLWRKLLRVVRLLVWVFNVFFMVVVFLGMSVFWRIIKLIIFLCFKCGGVSVWCVVLCLLIKYFILCVFMLLFWGIIKLFFLLWVVMVVCIVLRVSCGLRKVFLLDVNDWFLMMRSF